MQYAAELLFISGLAVTKTSVLFFLNTVTPVRWHKWVLYLLGAAVSIWGLTAVFPLAFECAVPSPWNYISTQCVNRVRYSVPISQKQKALIPLSKLALGQYTAALNIITDVALALLPVVIVLHLKTAWSRRLTMVICFGSRIL